MMRRHWPLLVYVLALIGSANAAELGRLFFTPAQRATLETARKQNVRVDVSNDTEQPAAPVPQHISVMGLVQRSDGKSTIWLNNRMVSEQQQQAGSGILVAPATKEQGVKLTVPESGRSVNLKVGQTVEVLSGTIAEGYSRGARMPMMEKPATAAETSARRGEQLVGPKAPPSRGEEAAVPPSREPQAAGMPGR